MVKIPGGSFQMGDTTGHGLKNELPVHAVNIKAFQLARHEVTVAQFQAFIAATGYVTEAQRNVVALLPDAINGCGTIDPQTKKHTYVAGLQWDKPGFEQTATHPVVCVSWNDAQEFIRWLNRETRGNFRLPTEAEWEYAARAHTATDYYWGSDVAQSCEYANGADQTVAPDQKMRWPVRLSCHDGYYYTSPVGTYAPNAFGLYDMLGNAREWSEDCYNDSYDDAPTDGSAWLTGNCLRRIARGDSLMSMGELRVAGRGNGGTLPARNNDFGFRLAQD